VDNQPSSKEAYEWDESMRHVLLMGTDDSRVESVRAKLLRKSSSKILLKIMEEYPEAAKEIMKAQSERWVRNNTLPDFEVFTTFDEFAAWRQLNCGLR